MEDISRLGLPFSVRDMLAFQHGAAFGLEIRSQSVQTSPLIIRGMTSEGLFAFIHSPTADSIVKTETFRIPDVPIWVSVTDKNRTLIQGETFATLSVTINDDILHELCAGLVYAQKSLTWPQNNSVDLRPGGGLFANKTSANPAAGSLPSITVPTGQIWKVLMAHVQLVTSATVAARTVHLMITRAGGGVYHFTQTATQAASLTREYTFATIGAFIASISGNDTQSTIPNNITVEAGDMIDTEVVNGQVDDDFGAMSLLVEQFFK